jgi:hypothetical protein
VPALTTTSSSQQRILSLLTESIASGEFVRLVLGNQRRKDAALKKIIVTPVMLRQGYRLKTVSRYSTKDITMNYTAEELIMFVSQAIHDDFFNADLFTANRVIQLSVSQKGKSRISIKDTSHPVIPTLQHDQEKKRPLDTKGKEYLKELGILNDLFQPRREMASKFVQINRYIELLEPHLTSIARAKQQLRIIDMGAGKGYLTFALYDYLQEKGINPLILGVEQRKELVDQCNEIAAKVGFSNLSFSEGSIMNSVLHDQDMLIALHACDIATDETIFQGIISGVPLIVVAPCCHKQVRNSIKAPESIALLTRHGILLERQAEILTDAIRSMVLEIYGYKTLMSEFVDPEHTPKNIMIIGRKTGTNVRNKNIMVHKIKLFMTHFGIQEHHLVTLLKI